MREEGHHIPYLGTVAEPSIPASTETAREDPEITAAGQRAYDKVLDGVTVDLSEEEVSILKRIANRQREAAESEANETKESSPESKLFSKLNDIANHLVSVGLDTDAGIITGTKLQITDAIDKISVYLSANPTERAYHSRDGGGKDINRATHYAGLRGDLKQIFVSSDLGAGARCDLNGTWYTPAHLADEKWQDQIKLAGGLRPVLTDQGLEIVLADLGIAPSGSDDLPPRNGHQAFSAQVEDQTFIETVGPGNHGGKLRTLEMRLRDDFLIQAALRKLGLTGS